MEKNTRPEESSSKLWKQPSRTALTHELKAIEYWDDNYRLNEMPDAVDAAAFRARQKRREQILQILKDFLDGR